MSAAGRPKLLRRGTIAAALVVSAVGWLALQSFRAHRIEQAAFPLDDGRIEVAGLSARVAIRRDARGFPHVEARSASDAFFGWGFSHAQDRLAQMLWLRLSAQGRSAEFAGPDFLDADRWARTLGFAAAAQTQLDRLPGPMQELLAAYAAGVNAWIDRIRSGAADGPVALKSFDVPLDRWLPTDSLAIAKLYCWNLTNTISASLVLRDINERLGSRAAHVFFPAGSGAAGPSDVTAGIGPAARDGRLRSPEREPRGLRMLARQMGLDGRGVGSSAWVVGGKSTESGHPILAADAHLEPTAPPLLHVAQVQGGDFDATGSAIPGIPVFWTGYNPKLAWASTHARAATLDLYEETLRESDPEQYHDGNRWRALNSRTEQLKVRGAADESLEVRSTRHGPLIHGLLSAEGEPLSLAWVGARPDVRSAFGPMTRVARSAGAEPLLRALADHHEPPLALAYADSNGERGTQVAGWLPVRALPTDLVPLPGRARWYDWSGRVPFERLPHATGGDWVIAADNRLQRGAPGFEIDWLWRSGSRAERIDALLRAESRQGGIDLRRMAALQADVASQRAPMLIALALDLAGPESEWSGQVKDVAALLRAWDGRSTPDSVGSSAYHVFGENLAGALLELTLGEPLGARYRALRQVDIHAVLIELMRLAGAQRLPADGVDLARVGQAVRDSLRDTWLRLSYRLGANRDKWRWGRLHQLSFRPFGADAAPLESMTDLPFGGSFDSVSPGEFSGGDAFDVRVVSAFRMVVDVGSLDQSLVAIAPGESEHPRHPHYRDGLAEWLAGRAGLLITDRVVVRESGNQRLYLEPQP